MKTSYLPAIDGLRAVAISIVVVSHFGADRFVPGGFGVTLFFFISGYLITTLLIEETRQIGRISIPAFYIRRVLRLCPALIVMVLTVSGLYLLLTTTISWPQVLAGLLYYTNYYGIFGDPSPMPLWPLWSLAVEEHYYLVYPLAFAFAWKSKRRFCSVLIVLSLAVLLWRTVLVLHWHVSSVRTYQATDTRIDSILYGAILATAVEVSHGNLAAILRHRMSVLAGGMLLLVSFIYRDPLFRETLRYTLQGIALIPLFYSILFAPAYSLVRFWLEAPGMLWLGRLSYSIYLYHFPVIFFVPKVLPGAGTALLIGVDIVVIIAAASCSYYFIERPFQRLRNRFRMNSDQQYSAQTVVARFTI